jgi:hypothetical protein
VPSRKGKSEGGASTDKAADNGIPTAPAQSGATDDEEEAQLQAIQNAVRGYSPEATEGEGELASSGMANFG